MNNKTIIFLIAIALIGIGIFTFLQFANNKPANDLSADTTLPRNGDKTLTIKVFFNNNELDPEITCNKVFSVERKIPYTKAVAQAALDELLSGPTEEEKNDGYFTSINSGVILNRVTIEDKIAKADFNEMLEYQVGGSCRVSAIRAQIEQTLIQFPSVNEVVISINGETEATLQP